MTTNRFFHSDIAAALYVWIIAAIVGVPVAIIGGVPAYFILQRFTVFNWLSVIIVGVVLGLLVHLTGFTYLSWLDCGAVGAASAFVAWLLLKNRSIKFEVHSFSRPASGRSRPSERVEQRQP